MRFDPNLPISADSHVVEPPRCYRDFIDPKFREDAPHVVRQADGGDLYVLKGLDRPINLARIASAGWTLEQMKRTSGRFEEIAEGSWNPKQRLLDQDRDGVAAEIVYPTVGMMLCMVEDGDYKHACMRAYNQWLEEFCAGGDGRLFGIGQSAVRSVKDAIEDLERIKAAGFKGAMLPASPCTAEDYDHVVFDPLWRAAVELDLPISFHSLTSNRDRDALVKGPVRGPRINGLMAIIRSCQDLIGMFIFGGVFDRTPGLKLVSVEADAGWAPHYMRRADHAYRQQRTHFACAELASMPSDYFKQNVYLTFQDDPTAFEFRHAMNPKRLMWANDFPHSDATWPNSRSVIEEAGRGVPAEEVRWIVRDNVAALYRLA
jgi:predicted TIM-barrel fold metal-dependent hydrolase